MARVLRLVSALALLLGFIGYFEVTGIQAAAVEAPTPIVRGCLPAQIPSPCERDLGAAGSTT